MMIVVALLLPVHVIVVSHVVMKAPVSTGIFLKQRTERVAARSLLVCGLT
ncbi:MAG: hypothetical protein LBD11_05410 [Candidatus Peribacteria bacterium]|nr:hypothetical protein [Candidatus Peribacteria bacterium]